MDRTKKSLVLFFVFLVCVSAQMIPSDMQQLAPSPEPATAITPDVVLRSGGDLTVSRGYISNVTLEVINVGSYEVENVVIDITPPQNATMFISGSTQRDVGKLEPGEKREISYGLASTFETEIKPYYLQVQVNYLKRNRNMQYMTGLGVNVISSSPFFSLETSGDFLEVGLGGNVSIEIENVAPFPANNTYITLKKGTGAAPQTDDVSTENVRGMTAPTAPAETVDSMIVGSATRFVNDLKPGESKRVNYTIIPRGDMEPGVYTYEASISSHFPTANQTVVQNYSLGLVFEGKPEVYLSSMKILWRGNGLLISGDANNVGSDTAKYVMLEIEENDHFSAAYSGSSYYVGTLEPDDFIPFELQSTQKGDASLPSESVISISYKDSRNREISANYTATVPPKPLMQEDAASNLPLISVIITSFAIVIFILLRRRKR